jgi:polar amino acid transport system substrate-binding protein
MRICLVILTMLAVIFTACAPSASPPATEGKLRIITEVYPPFNFVESNQNVTGQSTEVVRAIMQKLGIQASIEVMPLADGLDLAQKGPNVAIFSLNRTPQREALFKWVGPIGRYEQAFYAKKGSTISLGRLEDAQKAGKIGVYRGDAGNQFLASQGFTNLDESQSDVEALKKLMDNQVQLWLGNTRGLEITAKEADVNPDDLVALPVVVIEADLYIAFSKDVPDSTVAAWQSALDSLKTETDIDNKTVYDKILAKYEDPAYVQSLLK